MMTEQEKSKRVNLTEAVIACGGGHMTDDMRRDLDDVLEGRKTAGQVKAEIIANARRISGDA